MHTTPDATLTMQILTSEAFQSAFTEMEVPMLVACLAEGPEFTETVEILHAAISSLARPLKVGIIDEDSRKVFMNRFNIPGTPTFVIFQQGREIGRVLGMADRDMIREFVRTTVDAAS